MGHVLPRGIPFFLQVWILNEHKKCTFQEKVGRAYVFHAKLHNKSLCLSCKTPQQVHMIIHEINKKSETRTTRTNKWR